MQNQLNKKMKIYKLKNKIKINNPKKLLKQFSNGKK